MNLIEAAWLAWSALKAAGLVFAFDCLRRAPWPGITKERTATVSTADDITNHGGSKNQNTPTTKWGAIFEWAKQQGASTVLLFAAAVGIWRATPYLVGEFKAQADRHAAVEEKQRETFARTLEKVIETADARDQATRNEIKFEIQRLADRLPPK